MADLVNARQRDDDGGMNLVREHALPPFHLKVFYQRKHHRFRVEVSHEDGRCIVDHVDATYEPVCGIDFADNEEISAKAEEICRRMEMEPQSLTAVAAGEN